MKVLVTGGTGFTGKALVKRLLDEHHHVVALDYKEGIKTDELKSWGAEVVIGSVTDKSLIESTMKGVEVVHHLAAAFRELNVPNSYYDEVNVGGTKVVLEAAQQENDKKLIYCRTCGVHGNVNNPPADESAPIKPADYYQRTKYEAEPLVNKYNERGLKTSITRPSAIYGPGDPERFGMIFRRVHRGFFPIFGSGNALYHPLYVENLVDVHMILMEEGLGIGETYLVADNEYLTIEELVNRIARIMNKEISTPHFPIWPLIMAGHVFEKICTPLHITPPIFPRRVDWYRQNRAFDISKIRNELGYTPKIDLDQGLANTASWYQQEDYL